MVDKCPGSTGVPKPSYRKCPKCGAQVEIWSDEEKTKCPKCGATLHKENRTKHGGR
jgi:DNA-directed RNA polymerase subunit RPC12/RpoP